MSIHRAPTPPEKHEQEELVMGRAKSMATSKVTPVELVSRHHSSSSKHEGGSCGAGEGDFKTTPFAASLSRPPVAPHASLRAAGKKESGQLMDLSEQDVRAIQEINRTAPAVRERPPSGAMGGLFLVLGDWQLGEKREEQRPREPRRRRKRGKEAEGELKKKRKEKRRRAERTSCQKKRGQEEWGNNFCRGCRVLSRLFVTCDMRSLPFLTACFSDVGSCWEHTAETNAVSCAQSRSLRRRLLLLRAGS